MTLIKGYGHTQSSTKYAFILYITRHYFLLKESLNLLCISGNHKGSHDTLLPQNWFLAAALYLEPSTANNYTVIHLTKIKAISSLTPQIHSDLHLGLSTHDLHIM